MLTKSELLVDVLKDGLDKAKVGLLVRGFSSFTPLELLGSLADKVGMKINAAVVGYNCTETSSDKFELSTKIEDAVKWRNDAELSGRIIVLINNDSDKLHSLRELDVITTRSVSNRLSDYCIDLQTNEPSREFWKAIKSSLDFFSFDTLYDFVNALYEESALGDRPNDEAVSNNMWRLGLLPDKEILGIKVKPAVQIAQNREIIIRISQMSDDDRKRLATALSKAKAEDRDRYSKTYRNLQLFFKHPENRERLNELDFKTVRELLSTIKEKKDKPPGGDPNPPAVKIIREKELCRIISHCIVSSYEENKEYLVDLLDRIKEHFDSDDQPTDIGQLGGDEFESRSIVLDKHDTGLLTKVRKFCTEDTWGGTLFVKDTALRDAIKSEDSMSSEKFQPEEVRSITSYNNRALFDLLRNFDNEFRKRKLDDIDYFEKVLAELVECRDVLLENIDLIMYFPVLAFGVDDALRDALYKYVEKWGELLCTLNRNESHMRELSHKVAHSIARSILMLEILYIKTPTEWKGLLLPLHPLYLWRYYEVFKALEKKDEFNEQEASIMSSVITDLPQVLHFLVIDNAITKDYTNTVLPYSGKCEMLPSFENNTNRYLGDDGIECIEEVLTRWLEYAQYTYREIRICTVDAPNSAEVLKSLKDFIQKHNDIRLVYSIFYTRDQNGYADVASLEFDSKDYELGDYIRQGRLMINIQNFESNVALDEIKKILTEYPVHIAFYFDQSSYSIEHGPTTQQLYINPLVVTYNYDYDPVTHRGEIYPSTDTESGIIGDYHKLMRVADLASLNNTARPTYNPDVDLNAMLTTIEEKQTIWLVAADRIIDYYRPYNSIPIGEHRYKQRAVGIWASNKSRIIEQYMMLLRKYNLYPNREALVEILTDFGHIASDGLVSIPRSGGDSVQTENRRKGLIGTVFAAKYYSKKFPNSLIASLDTDNARTWLSGNILTDGEERADLIGLRYYEDTNTLFIESIEVKTRDETPDARVILSDDNERVITGHAADQVVAIILLIKQLFFGTQENMFTVARKEVLKLQIVSECFRKMHNHKWQQDWDAIFKKLFGFNPTNDLSIVVRGLLIHIKLGEPTQQPIVTCKHNAHRDCEIDLITLVTKDIQEFIFEQKSQSEVDWGNPDYDNTGEPEIVDDTSEIIRDQNNDSPNNLDGIREGIRADPRAVNAANVPEPTDAISNINTTSLEANTSDGHDESSVTTTIITDEQKAKLANDFKRSCSGYGIQIDECDPNKAIVGSSVIRFPFKLSRGQKMSSLVGLLEDIGREMRSTGILVQTTENADTFLDVPRRNREKVLFSDIISDIPIPTSPEQLFFPIGRTPDGTDVFQDLKDCPHLLVGGSTGSGKSVFLHTLLCAIIKTHPSADDCKILLASSKREDFIYFEGLPHLIEGRVISDASEMIEMFSRYILDETKRRSDLLVAARKNNIIKYNEASESKLAPLVVIIDEFADLTDQLSSTKEKNSFYTIFKEIAQAGRSKGIHLVLCTQRPSADVVPTNITANLNARLALRVNNANASRMIIDDKGAESLLKHGDMLYKPDSGSERIRAQGYFIDIDEVEAIVNEVVGLYE